MKKNLNDYIDGMGCINHLEDAYFRHIGFPTDGGDTLQRMGMTHSAEKLLDKKILPIKLDQTVAMLQYSDGEWTRHWNKKRWFGKRGVMSRDQIRSLLWAMAHHKEKKALLKVAWSLFKRLGFMWNTIENGEDADRTKWKVPGFSGPTVWGTIIRGVIYWPLYPIVFPVLLFLDVGILFNSIIIVTFSYIDPDETSNDLNHIGDVIGTKVMYPTSISWIARLIYVYGRGCAGETKETRLKGSGPQTALDHYFRPPKSPPINKMYEPVLIKYL